MTAVTSAGLLQERHGATLALTLNRPEARNALDAELTHALADAVIAAEADPDTRVLVLMAAGDKAFCAGMDLRAFAQARPGETSNVPDAFMRLLTGRTTVPVIAAVNAVAVGAGFELVLGADLVVAADSASFGLPEVRRGLFAGTGVVEAARRLPVGVALELTLTGERLDAQRAQALGLVNRVVSSDQLRDTALALAAAVAQNAPLPLAASKELVRAAASGAPDLDQRLASWLQRVFTSDDAREGAAAFLEKRQPVWRGV